MVEFGLVVFLLLCVVFGGLELVRAVFVYTSLMDAAKAGVRYAITHGSGRAGGSGEDGQSTSGSHQYVIDRVKYYSSGLNTDDLTVTVTYPDGNSNAPGSHVKIVVQYAYLPLTGLPYFKNAQLSATAQGIITF